MSRNAAFNRLGRSPHSWIMRNQGRTFTHLTTAGSKGYRMPYMYTECQKERTLGDVLAVGGNVKSSVQGASHGIGKKREDGKP